MIRRTWEKWKKADIETLLFLLLLFGMAVYYGWRVFALTPWYDELYTYYYFISKGPIYAAIHWPLPNNHVGYSVLSAILNLFGNPAIGLRGISWISALISLCLLFIISRKIFPKGLALLPVFIFSSMNMVNALAVQGRGYSLGVCLYLTALYELMQIAAFDMAKRKDYIILAASFILALYTLPSSVYFVIPLCVAGGGWLLWQKRIREFARLFITALISALCTIGLYTTIWLAIGSNLLSKTADSGYYGQGHMSIILHAPFSAARTGIRYMLDTPYIQSVPRKGYMSGFGIWIKALFENYYPGWSLPLIALVCIGIICVIYKLIIVFSKKRTNVNAKTDETDFYKGDGFLEWYMLLTFLLTPLMLIVQAALPYYRVFSFFAVPIALLITWMAAASRLPYRLPVLVGALCMALLFTPSYNIQYSDREAAIEDAFKHINLDNDDIICVTDCDQEYLVKYLCGGANITYIPQEADYILLDNKLLLPENTLLAIDSYADEWKLYMTYDEVPRDYLENETDIYYENDRFVVYHK